MSNPINSACVANALGIQPDHFTVDIRKALAAVGKIPAPLDAGWEYFDIVAIAALVSNAQAIKLAAQQIATGHRSGTKATF